MISLKYGKWIVFSFQFSSYLDLQLLFSSSSKPPFQLTKKGKAYVCNAYSYSTNLCFEL